MGIGQDIPSSFDKGDTATAQVTAGEAAPTPRREKVRYGKPMEKFHNPSGKFKGPDRRQAPDIHIQYKSIKSFNLSKGGIGTLPPEVPRKKD
ncbi:MAG: hypothetical protein PsegKO_36330 [Pseudohongiellaceae bacterium]